MQKQMIFAAITILLFAGACTGTTEQEAERDLEMERLPSVGADSMHESCPEPESVDDEVTAEETFADWASGASDVVVGTVDKLVPVEVPFRIEKETPKKISWEDDCDGDLLPALDVHLTDVTTLLGEDRDEVTFRLGRRLVQEWNASIKTDDSGKYWVVSKDDPDAGLVPGMRIGARLYESDDVPDALSPAMTFLFEVEAGENIKFQESAYNEVCPGDVAYYMREDDDVRSGLSVAELEAGLSGDDVENDVQVAPTDSSREYIRRMWNLGEAEHVIRFGAAYCAHEDW